MPNGRPGDHPLTDLFGHHQEVYGAEADDLIRKIGDLCPAELDEWWHREIAPLGDRDEILNRARLRHAELLRRAQESGEVRE